MGILHLFADLIKPTFAAAAMSLSSVSVLNASRLKRLNLLLLKKELNQKHQKELKPHKTTKREFL